MAQGVWTDRLVDPGSAGDSAHDAASAVPVHPLPVRSQEDLAVESFADGQVDRTGSAGCERNDHDLAALAHHSMGAVATFQSELDRGEAGAPHAWRWCSVQFVPSHQRS